MPKAVGAVTGLATSEVTDFGESQFPVDPGEREVPAEPCVWAVRWLGSSLALPD